ncbi:MAG: GDSL-type esterase/lipase family protein [Muribaculaceae bacterium]
MINVAPMKLKASFISIFVAASAMCFNSTAQNPLPVTASTAASEQFANVAQSQWQGFNRSDFTFLDREAIVVEPHQAAEGRPWIWRPAFFGAFPAVDIDLLNRGFHVVYYDLTHLYGSPRSLQLGTQFYEAMCRNYQLSPKVTLEGFSRGGLFVFRWAAANPQKVACIYADAPVCNVFSWPGKSRPDLFNDFLHEWGITEDDAKTFCHNPFDELQPLAQANIPIISVCGGSDTVVPYDENMKVLAERYRQLGGLVEIIVKPECEHHPHSLTDPAPVSDFIVRNQPAYQEKQRITRRKNLQHSYRKFSQEKKGCVAFLGGSITEMNGWRNMIQDDLKQRFPDTQFTFIDAGISSTGTTPHSFRLTNDVLQKGTPDLMFVEAAVNDHGNGFNYIAQTRGMEGIVRHALSAAPNMDIVMLHFIYDPFIDMLNRGEQPDVILNHERVANHYNIPSINLAEEIALRMRLGELTWQTFGGTHPAPAGHKYYAAAINRLFDMEWSGESLKQPEASTQLPTDKLDDFSYCNGTFVDINQATNLHGWAIDPNWHPNDELEKRKGFVDVPMLVTHKEGAWLTFNFTGTAVGIFCTCGPQAAVLEYSIDGAPTKTLNTLTQWSQWLYIPWVYIFDDQLPQGNHTLRLKVAKGNHTQCQIRNFIVNK